LYGPFARQWENLLDNVKGEYRCGAIQHGNKGKCLVILQALSDERDKFLIFWSLKVLVFNI